MHFSSDKWEVIMAKNLGDVVGSWAFLIGVVLAVVLGLFGPVTGAIATILVVIGLIVGLLNVADKEASAFLMSGAVLIIASAFGSSSSITGTIGFLGNILNALLLIFIPATIIVAVKNVFTLAKR